MTLRLISSATDHAVSLAEAKAHLRVEHDDDDALISALIPAAFAYAEKRTGKAFSEQTWTYSLDAFPEEDIEIPVGPLASVVSVAYLDADGETQTLDAQGYVSDLVHLTGRLTPVDPWPATAEGYNAVTVTFTLGGETPSDVKQAVLLLIGLWYDNRATATPENMQSVPMATEAILALHQTYHI